MTINQGHHLNEFEFTISRSFKAPIDRVWKAWSEGDQFRQWFGPKGGTNSHFTVDFRPGGKCRFLVELDGLSMWGLWRYIEITEPTRIVSIVSFTDDSGEKLIEHPMQKNWPLQILSTITFAEDGDKTRITVHWTAYQATEREKAAFENGASDMTQGWTGTFEQLDEFLARPA
jgi:uncharacterized protein YndB with AHSA1/START domain|tara:strand:+ start:2316 stop:2834 length:519 start_codon:yes stop_codon:yes gene_type:complete